MKNIILMGATGSVGRQVLEIIREYPERFKLTGVAIQKNIDILVESLANLPVSNLPEVVAIGDTNTDTGSLVSFFKSAGKNIEILRGRGALDELAQWPGAELMVAAIVGASGLSSIVKSLEAGRDVALANKEALIMAGSVVTSLSEKSGSRILPVDSEHSALFHLLRAHGRDKLEKIVLTASGGAFRDKSREELASVNVTEALNHPTWNMGKKITIDSATLVNKGLEVIEAHYLFGLDYSQIDVIIHKESLIHAMVEYKSGLMYAELSPPSMLFPIASALFWPESIEKAPLRLDLDKMRTLNFDKVDPGKYPALAICYEAGKIGGSAPIVLNAANEIAVDLFLREEIEFIKIPLILEKSMLNYNHHQVASLEEIEDVDKEARVMALQFTR